MRINILNKEGMLSTEDRKEKLCHIEGNFCFTSCLDLSKGVSITTLYGDKETYRNYSQALSAFISWWRYFVMKDLNGFSGFGCIDFKFNGFKLIE